MIDRDLRNRTASTQGKIFSVVPDCCSVCVESLILPLNVSYNGNRGRMGFLGVYLLIKSAEGFECI